MPNFTIMGIGIIIGAVIVTALRRHRLPAWFGWVIALIISAVVAYLAMPQ
jgi:tetrahydromethanopterin S-methyltransferase subunit C